MAIYLRFVVEARDPSTGYRFGIMHGLRLALDDSNLPLSDHERLDELRRWFSSQLQQPSRFSKKRNSNHRNHRGLSWFKDSATQMLSNAREVLTILEANGLSTTLLSTARPGFVVYEDEYQIVAEPFADTPT